ncbi:MAG: hypothetical protein JRN22_00410 [Nitrososphaerota archaeon]|nr:hypothetical protein [Nitrososphaerota archaeon]
MTENQRVGISVEVSTKGSEALQQLHKDLQQISKQIEDGAKITTKHTAETVKQNMSLQKQIPVLRELQPLLSAMNMSWVASATAIAGVSAGSMMAYQSFQTWFTSVQNLAVAFNIATGGTESFGDAMLTATKLSSQFNMPMTQIADSLTAFYNATHDATTSTALLTDVIKIQQDTALPLKTIVDDLTNAWQNGTWVGKQYIPAGIQAIQAVEKQLDSTATDFTKAKAQIDDTWSTMWSDMKIGAGTGIEGIKLVIESGLLAITGKWQAAASLWESILNAVGISFGNTWKSVLSASTTQLATVANPAQTGHSTVEMTMPGVSGWGLGGTSGAGTTATSATLSASPWTPTSVLPPGLSAQGSMGLLANVPSYAVSSLSPQALVNYTKIKGYASGGLINVPTLLTNLLTGRHYGVAGERGTETISPGNNLQPIQVFIGDELIYDRMISRLNDQVRLKGAF